MRKIIPYWLDAGLAFLIVFAAVFLFASIELSGYSVQMNAAESPHAGFFGNYSFQYAFVGGIASFCVGALVGLIYGKIKGER